MKSSVLLWSNVHRRNCTMLTTVAYAVYGDPSNLQMQYSTRQTINRVMRFYGVTACSVIIRVLSNKSFVFVFVDENRQLITFRLLSYAAETMFYYSRPRIAPAIAEDLDFGRVISFFHHRFFHIPAPIFAKLCHTTRCVLKYCIS